MTEVRYCSTCRHWPGDDHCTGCRYEAGANTKWEPPWELHYDTTFDKIISEIEREADYQDAELNADIARGMYKAIEIVKKCKSRVKGGEA